MDQARRVSNPQPAVLETAALPIELLAFKGSRTQKTCTGYTYSITLATTPAPTVRPPSRIAKRKPPSIATGAIKVTTILVVSPGMTISTPSGNLHSPVTSVVLK